MVCGVAKRNGRPDNQAALYFLDPGKNYQATIYTDNEEVPTATHVAIEHRKVNSKTVITLPVKARHGVAIYFTPIK